MYAYMVKKEKQKITTPSRPRTVRVYGSLDICTTVVAVVVRILYTAEYLSSNNCVYVYDAYSNTMAV